MTPPTRRRAPALALALTLALAAAAPAAAAPPTRDTGALDRATTVLAALWDLFFGTGPERLGGASEEGSGWDPNGVTGSGDGDEGLIWDPDGVAGSSDGDNGPIWDPNG